jgi:uncharacterized protein with HEPN domain
MLEAVEKATTYCKGMSFEDFEKDSRTMDAVVRNLEILGEAASKIPESFRDSHPHIDWHKIVGLRHRIVHEYFGVDNAIIWRIVQNDLPRLHIQIKKTI